MLKDNYGLKFPPPLLNSWDEGVIMDVNKHCYLNKINWRLGRIFSHTELLTYEILYPMMLNMQKIQFSFINCMIRIIENGVAADLRKTEATSDL